MEAEQEAQLVHRGDLESVLREMIEHERSVVKELELIVPNIVEPSIKKGLERKLSTGIENLRALEAGYIPINRTWTVRTDTKSKWPKKTVEQTIATMPEHLLEAWERAKELGVFKNFSITAERGGDPVLVGNAGGKQFLIGAWVNFEGGFSYGFCVKGKAVPALREG